MGLPLFMGGMFQEPSRCLKVRPVHSPQIVMFSSTQMPMDIYKLGTIEINNLWPSGTINT